MRVRRTNRKQLHKEMMGDEGEGAAKGRHKHLHDDDDDDGCDEDDTNNNSTNRVQQTTERQKSMWNCMLEHFSWQLSRADGCVPEWRQHGEEDRYLVIPARRVSCVMLFAAQFARRLAAWNAVICKRCSLCFCCAAEWLFVHWRASEDCMENMNIILP